MRREEKRREEKRREGGRTEERRGKKRGCDDPRPNGSAGEQQQGCVRGRAWGGRGVERAPRADDAAAPEPCCCSSLVPFQGGLCKCGVCATACARRLRHAPPVLMTTRAISTTPNPMRRETALISLSRGRERERERGRERNDLEIEQVRVVASAHRARDIHGEHLRVRSRRRVIASRRQVKADVVTLPCRQVGLMSSRCHVMSCRQVVADVVRSSCHQADAVMLFGCCVAVPPRGTGLQTAEWRVAPRTRMHAAPPREWVTRHVSRA